MEKKRVGKDCVLWRMRNSLRGQAMYVRESYYLSPEDRKEQMDTIEDIMHFFEDYDKNMQILQSSQKRISKENDRGE